MGDDVNENKSVISRIGQKRLDFYRNNGSSPNFFKLGVELLNRAILEPDFRYRFHQSNSNDPSNPGCWRFEGMDMDVDYDDKWCLKVGFLES